MLQEEFENRAARQNRVMGKLSPHVLLQQLTGTLTSHVSRFFIFSLFLQMTVVPGPPLFSLTIQRRHPFPCPATFVPGQRFSRTVLAAVVLWAAQLGPSLRLLRQLFK